MKTAKRLFFVFLTALLVAVPAVADAHGFGGGALLGFGLGLFTGFAFAARPVYVAPPVYYAPQPPVTYQPYPYYVPAPDPPAAYGYSNRANVPPANVSPVGESRCREWRMMDRHWENQWDAHIGKWRAILVERWGWAGIPCND